MNDLRLILASASIRRRELFSMIGLKYEVIPSLADEDAPLLPPGEFVEQLAFFKANSVFEQQKDKGDCCVVGCDTIVEIDGKIIGKPRDEADACRILRLLSGRTHTVYTGICVMRGNITDIRHDTTRVTFSKLTDAEIKAYVATGEPMDKAGAYGIQGVGGVLVCGVEGCYFTVVGLPLPMLYDMLKKAGIDVLLNFEPKMRYK
ncbi:MAG: septum formation inhibitor Maf [Clostridia bacterium]|nr:septum formation inhibitor Maf [Clostridia bacterium]